MSLQWTLIAGFLYVEIFVVLLLVLPIASPKRWQKVFRSKFLQSVSRQASIYFLVLLAILVLFLLDAIREMRKYSNAESSEHGHGHLDAEMQGNMRLFRAQRNFYISGFALFLSLVIRRLVTLLSEQATLIAQSEAAMKQAQSASSVAKNLLDKSGESTQNAKNDKNDAQKIVDELKNEVKKVKDKNLQLQDEIKKEKKDKEAIKSQAESLSKEYDRLSQEYSKLQAASNKKSD